MFYSTLAARVFRGFPVDMDLGGLKAVMKSLLSSRFGMIGRGGPLAADDALDCLSGRD